MSHNIDPFQRQWILMEAKSTLTAKIKSLTSGKQKKYIKYSELKKAMNLDDTMFDDVMKSARKSNRHSNKYIFTEVDDEDAVGITATKRKKKEKPPSKEHELPGTEPGYGMANTATTSRAFYHRQDEVWGVYNKYGWKGLDRLDLLPEGWQKMTGTKIVEAILEKEFSQ